ncbi:thiamine diphosphokinase [Salimicrobium flavidum]|uniref:Thiamine diphosphokinase n=1 Tax=Salimicrobium flavidum TaxID=570947 RepID=A0A1N7ILD2_9BACI|nr:thiamine diphosphokinase [Salimicrobium flavidum]SIS37796.1 thiamine diphosphokinase [Salimicrobium flavidum]
MKTVAIVGGGPIQYIPDLVSESASLWIGADSGAQFLVEHGLPVDIAIGDFDSISETMFKKIKDRAGKTEVFPAAKDETDLELALQEAVRQEADSILLYGVTGGRMDHTLANIQLLHSIAHHGVNATIVDSQNEMELKLPGHYRIKHSTNYPYVSFIPISLKVEGLTLEGFKYALKDRQVPIGSTLCLSNEISDDSGAYSFEDGIVLVVRSRDEKNL